MPTLSGVRQGAGSAVVGLDRALGRVGGVLAAAMPRRLRRLVERIETQRTGPYGHYAAVGLLAATVAYGVIGGGHVGAVVNAGLAVIGFGIEEVRIGGQRQTSELAVIEALGIDRKSLITLDAAAARARVAALPWVAEVSVRKLYPSTLAVDMTERRPFALWQDDGVIRIVDREGSPIVRYDGDGFGHLPLVVGEGANLRAATIWPEIRAFPSIAARLRAAVLIAGRRWDLHLENGVTVKLPEKGADQALTRLVDLDLRQQLLARDVTVIDLRLPDRVTVRLPEGQPVPSEQKDKPKTSTVKVAGART